MEQTPTGFDDFIEMQNEWLGKSQSVVASHSASGLKNNDTKRRAFPKTTQVLLRNGGSSIRKNDGHS
jgi:hypothetical protein